MDQLWLNLLNYVLCVWSKSCYANNRSSQLFRNSYLCCNNRPMQVMVCHAPLLKNNHTQNQPAVYTLTTYFGIPTLEPNLRKKIWLRSPIEWRNASFSERFIKPRWPGLWLPVCLLSLPLFSSESMLSSHSYSTHNIQSSECYYTFFSIICLVSFLVLLSNSYSFFKLTPWENFPHKGMYAASSLDHTTYSALFSSCSSHVCLPSLNTGIPEGTV